MKTIARLFDRLLTYAVSLIGGPAPGLSDYVEVYCLPDYLEPRSHHHPRPARRRMRFAHP